MLDKPPGLSSAQAVSKVKRLLPPKTKIGHTGTLDPLASGLLVLVLGRATRLSRYVTPLDKSYTTTARFGAVTDTLDAEGEVTTLDAPFPDESALRAALPNFIGRLEQVPPMASALKVGGARLYDLHRRGVAVEREARPVEIHAFGLTDLDPANETATFEISCSSGTYVRSLVSDLADSLGTGAYLTNLRRTRVGKLKVQDAVPPDALNVRNIVDRIIHSNELVRWLPEVTVSKELGEMVRHGRMLAVFGVVGSYRVVCGGELLAVYRDEGGEARAEVVLCAR